MRMRYGYYRWLAVARMANNDRNTTKQQITTIIYRKSSRVMPVYFVTFVERHRLWQSWPGNKSFPQATVPRIQPVRFTLMTLDEMEVFVSLHK